MPETSSVVLAAIVINFAVCMTAIVCHFRLRTHLRERHPLIWSQFGFPMNSPLVSPEEEKAETHADSGLSEYLRSGNWRKLNDARLSRLVRAERIAFYAGCLTMTGCVVAFVVAFALGS